MMSFSVNTPFMRPSLSTTTAAVQFRDARRSPTSPSAQSILQVGVSSFRTNSPTGECSVRLAADGGRCVGAGGRLDSTTSSAESTPTATSVPGCTTTRWCSRRSAIVEAASVSFVSPATSRASASPGEAWASQSAMLAERGTPLLNARKKSRGVMIPRTPSWPSTSRLFCRVTNMTFSTCCKVYLSGQAKTSSQVFMASCTVLPAMSPRPTPGTLGQEIAWASSREERTPRRRPSSPWTIM
mmetsp:Transcript_20660/g.64891  ORF Transcript_20660/g.64891 Transcript_20660/m.64891 type:complete len:241 (-) Transcript_20660:350-1072(-)